MYAALETSRARRANRTAVISKLLPIRSHTGTAQGGIGAALGNIEEDKPEWHGFDTVKGGDYLVDQQAAAILADDAVQAVYDLENRGLPFSRTQDGRIDQRRFGGHTRNFGEAPVRRACYAADRTGHMILQTLYQQCIKNEVSFFDEFHVVDVLVDGRRCAGVVALELATGLLHIFQAKAVMMATGGFGRMFRTTSNAYANTGDGPAVLARRGVPLEDMEFFQFHPTGIRSMGILITEGVPGKDDYLYLDATGLDAEVLATKLPDISDFCRTYLRLDPAEEPIPVQPTAHYAMGGVPTDLDGRVVADAQGELYEGLYAAGECACVSVHGANRLGTNSLVDLIVFGRRAGRHMSEFVNQTDLIALPAGAADGAIENLQSLRSRRGDAGAEQIRMSMKAIMMDAVGIYRDGAELAGAVKQLQNLRAAARHVSVGDTTKAYNTELLELLELQNLLDLALVTAICAEYRKETRGAHAREDFPDRDDQAYLKHALAWLDGGSVRLDVKPVDLSIWEPKPREY
jgi:succinate dehydrogenase / fumarate reductase flavoprotein subunit